MANVFTIEFWLPQPRYCVFPFFADARNLQSITPPWLRFEVLTPPPIVMQRGTRIDYRLRIHGIPFNWQSEITCWEPPFRFRDEQRRGPYRTWIHTHEFTEREDGTLCRDQVEYTVPGGRLVDALFVRRDVESIFAYRRKALQNRFRPASPS